MIVLDTSGLLAAIDATQPDHLLAAQVVTGTERRLLSPFVLAELDYLVATRIGQGAELAFLQEVERGVYQLEPFTAQDVRDAMRLIEQYADLGLGLADASVAVIASRHGCEDILTLDERHFRAVSRRDGRSFRLLPRDFLP